MARKKEKRRTIVCKNCVDSSYPLNVLSSVSKFYGCRCRNHHHLHHHLFAVLPQNTFRLCFLRYFIPPILSQLKSVRYFFFSLFWFTTFFNFSLFISFLFYFKTKKKKKLCCCRFFIVIPTIRKSC